MKRNNIIYEALTQAGDKLIREYCHRIVNYNAKHDIRLTNLFIPFVPNDYINKRRIVVCTKVVCGRGHEFSIDGSTHFNPYVDAEMLIKLQRKIKSNALDNIATASIVDRNIATLTRLAKDNSASLVHTNLVSIGYEYGNNGFDLDFNDQFAQYKRSEFKLLSPNLFIALTGPNYDFYFRRWIGNFDLMVCQEDIPVNQLTKMKFTDGVLAGVECYRTYSPGYYKYIGRSKIATKIKNFINNLIINQ